MTESFKGSNIATDSFAFTFAGPAEKMFVAQFAGVRAVRANNPEGMMLYALSEFKSDPPLRRFVFANWDDNGEAFLEIDAESSIVQEL